MRGAAKAVQRPRRLLCPYRVARTSALLRAAHLVLWQPAFSWSRSGELAESPTPAPSPRDRSKLLVFCGSIEFNELDFCQSR